ncbi:hypothetical protein [Mycolicibacterium hodleri]|uniref:Integral membrane protein n=1 Tax=Mycolicibacterium hodleri TaxID=49897 RepID=A0A502EFD1_9MYCO|nr:hypothetical protein [Mycolicibacterium hodleri]TPG35210.1 hypothetical protein EAH80_10690 [Mycolicibacterium hodleri]
MRALSFAFGLLMVAAATVQSDGSALAVSAAAFVAVVLGIASRMAATFAVVAAAVALALSSPSPVVAMIAGLAATAYLVLRHARGGDAAMALTAPTVLGALGLSVVAVLGAAVPAVLPWVPLVAPLAVVVIYLAVIAPFVS